MALRALQFVARPVLGSGKVAAWLLVMGLGPACGEGWPTTEQPRCSIEAKSAQRAVIAVPGLDFLVEALGVPLTAKLRTDGWADVEVRGALEYSGFAKWPGLPIALSQEVSVGSGVLRLHRGQDRLTVRRAGLDADADVTFGSAHFGTETVRGFPVPCPALTLDAFAPGEKDRDLSDLATRNWIPSGRDVHVRAEPQGDVALTVEVRGEWEKAAPRFGEIDRAGDFVRVRRRWPRADLDGWVEASELRPAPDGAWAYGWGCGGGFLVVEKSPTEYVGPASVEPGTEVLGEPGQKPWAKVRAPGPYQVRIEPGSDWVALVKAPDVFSYVGCGCEKHQDLWDAWVPRSAVHPGGASWVRMATSEMQEIEWKEQAEEEDGTRESAASGEGNDVSEDEGSADELR